MPLRPSLLSEIRDLLGPSLIPSLTSSSDANDLYEAYLFTLICQAAIDKGAIVEFRNIGNVNQTTFVFRTSPGYIGSTNRNYGYALINFPNKPMLEAHVGVRVAGTSKVLHECDICVLLSDEAELCRNSLVNIAPRASKVIISVEAKFYDSSLGLGLGRAFLGFTMDVSAYKSYFVINRESRSIERLLSHKKRFWDHNIQPQNIGDVNRLKGTFQAAFKDFKAKY
jgi:hypothetical protein